MKTWLTSRGHEVHRVLSGRCNCHLVCGEKGYLLVDCGGKRHWKRLCDRLQSLGVSPDAPLSLVLTHAHFDHAENAAALKREFNAAILVHENAANYLRKGENPPIHGTLAPTRLMTRILNASPWLAQRLRYTGVSPDRRVHDETDLRSAGFPVTLLPTPGHTSGSMSVIVDNQIALTGDALFGVFPGSAFPPFAEDPGELVRSWKKLLDTGCSLFLPAHGRPRSRATLHRQYRKHAGRRCL